MESFTSRTEYLTQLYSKSIYKVTGIPYEKSSVIDIQIGQNSKELDEFLNSQNATNAILITAYNPNSTIVSEEENITANKTLEAELKKDGYKIFSATSETPDSNWPAEPGYMVLNIEPEIVQHFLKKYKQDAIILYILNKTAQLVFTK